MPTEKLEPQAELQSPPAEPKPLSPDPKTEAAKLRDNVIFRPIPQPIEIQIRWRTLNILRLLGIDAFDEKKKVETIIERFKFKDMDDATLRLHEAIHHSRQEAQGKPKAERELDAEGRTIIPTNRMPASPEIVDLIFIRIKNEPKETYQKPLVGCHVFSYLLTKIGEHFGHKCHMVSCDPSYLQSNGKGNGHVVVFDETAGVYRDASVYRAFNPDPQGQGRSWCYGPPGYPQRANVPKDTLNIIEDPAQITKKGKFVKKETGEKPETK